MHIELTLEDNGTNRACLVRKERGHARAVAERHFRSLRDALAWLSDQAHQVSMDLGVEAQGLEPARKAG